MKPKEKPFDIYTLFDEAEAQEALDYLLTGTLPPQKDTPVEVDDSEGEGEDEEIELPHPLQLATSEKSSEKPKDELPQRPLAVSLSVHGDGTSNLEVNGENISQKGEYANTEPGTVVTHTLPEKSVFSVGTVLTDVVFSDLVLPGEWEVTEIHPGEDGRRQVAFTKKE